MPDRLDLRDLAKEWRDLLEEIDDAHADEDADLVLDMRADVEKYESLCAELGLSPTTPDALEYFADNYDATLIAESDFANYAEELAEDIGAIDESGRWPVNCIDWERAANELASDYTSVTYDGDDYYIRT